MELFKNNRKMFFSSILLVLQLSAQYCNISAVTGHPSTASLRRKKPSDGAKRNIRIVLLSVKCTNALPQIIEFFECQMNRRNDRVYTSGSLRLREPIARLDANVFYHLSGQLKSIFNLTLDCCALLANGRHNSKIFDSVLKILFARINVLPHCPLKAVSSKSAMAAVIHFFDEIPPLLLEF